MTHKPGWRTSEFWVMIGLASLAAVVGFLPDGSFASKVVLAILSSGAVLGYGASRGLTKRRAASSRNVGETAPTDKLDLERNRKTR